VINYIFKDSFNTQYLVSVFDENTAHLAIRDEDDFRWSAPIPLIRTEKTE